jgi:WD40 repeat protein
MAAACLALLSILALGTAAFGLGPQKQPPADSDPLPPGAVLRLGTTRLRTTATSLAFAADGKTLLTASGNFVLGRWDPETGRLRDEVDLPGGLGSGPWFSPDGKLLAVIEGDGLGVWDTATGKRLHRLAVRPEDLGPLAISADGQTVATAEYKTNDKGRVHLWDLATGKERQLAELPSYANDLVFDRDAKRLFAAVDNHSLRCWDTASGKQLWQNDHWASRIALSADGKLLAANSYLGREPPQLWDAATGERIAVLGDVKLEGPQVGFAPDGRTVAVGPWHGGVRLFDATTHKLRHHFREAGSHFAFAPDGKSLVTAGHLLQRWDVESGKPLYPDTSGLGHAGGVDALAFAPDGKSLASSGVDNTVRIWALPGGGFRILRTDAPGGRWRYIVTGGGIHVGSAAPLDFTPDGKLLLTDVAAGALAVTDVATGKEVRRFLFPTVKNATITTAAARLTADGKRVIALGATHRQPTGSMDLGRNLEPVRAWNIGDGKEDLATVVPCGTPNLAALGPDGRLLAVPMTGVLLDLRTGVERPLKGKTAAHGPPLAFSPDGRLLAVGEPGLFNGPTTSVQIFETLTGRPVARVEADLGHTRALAFSADSRLLAASGRDALFVWECSSGGRLMHLPAQGRLTQWQGSGFASCLAFAPDGKALATGHAVGVIYLWDLAPAAKVLAAKPPAKADPSAAWSDLLTEDAAVAYAAIDSLAVAPAETLPLFKPKLRPAIVEKAWLAARLKALDADEFEARDEATRDLKKVAVAVESELRDALAAAKVLEMRRRIEAILDTVKGVTLSAEDLRQLRAVIVLERIGLEEARSVLRDLAGGAADAPLTREARAALDRLARRAAAGL